MNQISTKRTTISLKKTTRDLLASIGTKDSSFEQIIKKLIDRWGVKK